MFIFNGSEYPPFTKDGSLAKIYYNFPAYQGRHYAPENINDFLIEKKPPKPYVEPKKDGVEGFPKAVMSTKKSYPIPAVGLDDKPHDIKKLLSPLKIFVTPSQYFYSKLNDVFQLTPPTVATVSDYGVWVEEPNMKYWSQQLNFAVWCATSGCGISYDLIEPDTQIGCILRFHVLYTIRSVLSDLQVPLPWDNSFIWSGTRYNKGSLAKLCNEFGISNPDFRFNGISTDSDKFSFHYTSPYKDSLTAYYTSTHKDRSQYNWFIPQKGQGITKAGMSRLNQSIEAFVYCVLGSQVNTRSSIIGDSGSAKETQDVFLQLFKSSVIEKDISKRIQRYQFAIQEAKVKLDLAISPGSWLLPSSLVINTKSTIGYNNKLRRATKYMVFGVNNINQEIIPVVKHNMGHSKTKLPHIVKKPEKHTDVPTLPAEKKTTSQTSRYVGEKHENNIAVITIVAAGVSWYMFR